MAVDDGGNGSLKNDLGLGVHMDGAVFDGLVVAHQTLCAVGLDAVNVGKQQHVGDLLGFLAGKAEFFKSVHAKALDGVDGKV